MGKIAQEDFVKKNTTVVLILFFITAINGFTQNITDSDIPQDMNAVLSNKKLTVAITSADQPPFYYINKEGRLTGYDIDTASHMAKELNVELVINRDAASFNDLIALVASGKADLAISKLSRTLARARYVKFSTPYIVFKQGLLLNRLQLAKITTEDNINSFVRNYVGTLGVIKASSYVNYARENFPRATIREYDSWDDVIKALNTGEILAAYRDELEIKRILNNMPNSSLKFKPIYFTDLIDPIAIAVKSENTQLLYWVNTFLEAQGNKVTADEILSMYKDK